MFKRVGLILQLCNHILYGFNAMSSFALGSVNVNCKIGKWKCPLDFVVVEHPSKISLGYTDLKQLELSINCQNDNLQDTEGSQLLCHAIRNVQHNSRTHIKRFTSTPQINIEPLRDVLGQRVIRKPKQTLAPSRKIPRCGSV